MTNTKKAKAHALNRLNTLAYALMNAKQKSLSREKQNCLGKAILQCTRVIEEPRQGYEAYGLVGNPFKNGVEALDKTDYFVLSMLGLNK